MDQRSNTSISTRDITTAFAFLLGLIVGASAQSEWTEQTSGTTNNLHSVIWTGTQLVAVGFYGAVTTSLDGIDWTTRESGLGFSPSFDFPSLSSVTWTGSKLVAVGSGPDVIFHGGNPSSILLTSPDGIAWIMQNSGTRSGLSSVIWTGESAISVVAVGEGGTIRTSHEGIIWAAQTSGTTEWLSSVTWTGTQFVVVGDSGAILTSPNGSTWTTQSSGTTNGLYSVIGTGTQLVAVGDSGVILTSPNGIVWTAQTSETMNELRSVIWTGTQLVAVGSGGIVITSPDGITWTPRTSGISNTLYSVTWTGSQFVAVGAGGTILTSPDDIPNTVLPHLSLHGMSLRFTTSHLFATLPHFLKGQTAVATIYTVKGGKRVEVRTMNNREIVIPIGGLAHGRYVLEVRSAGKSVAQPVEIGR